MKTLVLSAAMALMPPQDDASALVAKFMQAWSAGDARELSTLFTPDADLITPDGVVVKGRENLAKFYAYVFANGYAGSAGTGEIETTQALVPTLDLVDARWSISGAHAKDGSLRPAEKGIMAAVLEKDAGGWHIRVLRENRGATGFKTFAVPE